MFELRDESMKFEIMNYTSGVVSSIKIKFLKCTNDITRIIKIVRIKYKGVHCYTVKENE